MIPRNYFDTDGAIVLHRRFSPHFEQVVLNEVFPVEFETAGEDMTRDLGGRPSTNAFGTSGPAVRQILGYTP